MRSVLAAAAAATAVLIAIQAFSVSSTWAATETNPVVYNIYQPVNLGNPGEAARKDFYISVGSQQGIRKGMILRVSRKVPSPDVLSEKFFRDVTIPIAQIKVIHVEGTVAIARLVKLLPADEYPAVSPHAVMLGDLIEPDEN